MTDKLFVCSFQLAVGMVDDLDAVLDVEALGLRVLRHESRELDDECRMVALRPST